MSLDMSLDMSLESRYPSVFEQLALAGEAAERHLRNVADLEFTFVNAQLFVIGVQKARLSKLANIRSQLELLVEGVITPEEVLERISPADIDGILTPEIVEKDSLNLLGNGLPAGGGCASGRIAFSAATVEKHQSTGSPIVLVVHDLSRRDARIAKSTAGVLATTGGISSHAALICRPLNKPCVVGFTRGSIASDDRVLSVPGFAPFHEGDWITVDGLTGHVYSGQAPVEVKSWQSHPEVLQLSLLVEKAVSTGHVPEGCAGKVWRIWDFMRHGLPLCRNESLSRKRDDGKQYHPRTAARDLAAARRVLTPIDEMSRTNYSEILLGLIATIDRQLRMSQDSTQPCSRMLWDPGRQIQLGDSSQFVGLEFCNLNRRIPHLIEIADIRLLLECEVKSPSEAWTVESDSKFGPRVCPKSSVIKACYITINGAKMDPEDLPRFYTWLRRREYFWRCFEERQTSHRELTTFLENYRRERRVHSNLELLCHELGLLKQGQPTAAGLSLMGRRTKRRG